MSLNATVHWAEAPSSEPERIATGDEIALRYHCTTPYYDIIVLTSPARIEHLGIDPAGRGDHFGVVNNFGARGSGPVVAYGASMVLKEDHASDAGRPGRVRLAPGKLVLEGIPVGDRGLRADWGFTFDKGTFDVSLDWHADRPQADLWEAGWKLDGIARHVADATSPDLPAGPCGSYRDREEAFLAWWEDDPRYAHTLVAAFVPGSAERGDQIVVAPNVKRPVTWGAWYAIYRPGGASLAAGPLRGGRWRIGASGQARDFNYARLLVGEAAGTGAAVPHAGPEPRKPDLIDELQWARILPSAAQARLKGPAFVGPDRTQFLADGETLVAFVADGDEYRLRLFAADVAGDWRLSAMGGPSQRFSFVAPTANGQGLLVRASGLAADGTVLSETEELWMLRGSPSRVHVETRDTPVGRPPMLPMHSFLFYPEGKSRLETSGYDVLASPHLRPQADLVVGQHAMRAPSLAIQRGASSFALVPDLLFHRQHGHYGAEHAPAHFGLCLDFDVANRLVDAPLLGFGWRQMEWVYLETGVEQGGYYCRGLEGGVPDRPTELAFDLFVSGTSRPRSIIADVQRFLWEQVGRRYFEQSLLPQTQPADAAFDEAWHYWAEMYDCVEIDGKQCGGVRVDADFPPDIMFTAWFNALRSSYAIFARGKAKGDPVLLRQGRSTLDLLLSAPRREGAFPTLARFTPQGIHWIASHKNFANQMPWGPGAYHTMDMSWVAYTVLRWYQDLEVDEAALRFACDYGDFLLARQLPSGAIPSWFAATDLSPDPHLRESAQTSASALFLAELAWVTGAARYRNAALAASRFLVDNCVEPQRWDDFEVYYSNSPKSEGAADPISGQKAQDTLSMHFAAAALLRIYQLTRDRQWLDAGEISLASMLQYQAVWLPSFLSVYTFGGFSVQNSDQEWLDARQSQLALTLLDYARETGRADYAERGIAALRSGYATMCSPSAEAINPRHFDAQPVGWGNENFAHSAYDTLTQSVPTPCYDWGVGSAAAGYAEARLRFGDVWIDGRARRAFGIDDVAVRSAAFRDDAVELVLSSPRAARRVVIKGDGFESEAVDLTINGEAAGRVSRRDLAAGIEVGIPALPRLVHNPFRLGAVLANSALELAVRVEGGQIPTSVRLSYRTGGGGWEAMALRPSGECNWRGILPTTASVRGKRLDYAFEATFPEMTITAPEVDALLVPFSQRVD